MKRLKSGRAQLKTLLLFLAILCNLRWSGCSISKPQMPSWDSAWDLPLINKTYGIEELLDKLNNSSISFDTSGNPGIDITQKLDTVNVDNNLKINGMQLDLRDSVGNVEVKAPQDIVTNTLLSSIVDISLGFVPPASFAFAQPLPTFTRFTWATIDSGVMNVTFFNNMEIDLDTLIITVMDSADMHVVGVIACDNGLRYLETETQSIDISGQTISNSLVLQYHGHTPGGVLINAGAQNLEATASFPGNLIVSAARAEILDITRNKSQIYNIADSTKVNSSTISRGIIQFNILNQTELPFTITLHSPNFTMNGAEFQMTQQLIPNDQTQLSVDLAGYNFIPSNGDTSQTVLIEMINHIPGSAPSQYTFRASDSLLVHIDISDIHFQMLTGRIEPSIQIINPIQANIDLPMGIDRSTLNRARMILNLYNNSMVPTDLNLTIDGDGKSIPLSGRIMPKSSPDDPPQLTTLTLGPEDLTEFLSPPPAEISMSGYALVNPDYEIVTVTANDGFYGDVELVSPLAMEFSDTVSILPGITHADIDPNSRPKDFENTAKSGKFEGTLQNNLPLGIKISFYFGTESDSALYASGSTLILGPYPLSAAAVDSLGQVTTPVSSDVSDSLTSDEMAVFDHDRIYIAEKVDIMPTDSGGVLISGLNYLRIRGMARMQLHIGDNIWR